MTDPDIIGTGLASESDKEVIVISPWMEEHHPDWVEEVKGQAARSKNIEIVFAAPKMDEEADSESLSEKSRRELMQMAYDLSFGEHTSEKQAVEDELNRRGIGERYT